MFFDIILKIKFNKSLVLFLAVISIVNFWYIEKTKRIPQYGFVLYRMGLNCEDECGQDKQLRYFQRAVRYNSQLGDTYYDKMLSDAHYRSALIYEGMGDHARAIESFIKATEFNPEKVLAYYKIGISYFQEENHEYALRYFLRLKSFRSRIICPDDTIYYIAQTYDKLKKYDLALVYYHGFVEEYSEYVSEVYPRVVEIYCLLNDMDSALYKIHMLRARYRKDLGDQLEQAFKAAKVPGV